MRRSLVAGNWKMHGSIASVEALLSGLAAADSALYSQADTVLCPPHLHIPRVGELAAETGLQLGGQNCSEHTEGAYTGEVSAAMLADCDCQWVILGHSERRQYFGESNELVAAKASAARAAGLKPMLCVGETLEQRSAGNAQEVVTSQLAALVAGGLEATDVIAYEPIWAIGTGQTASPEQAQEMHAAIRTWLREQIGETAEAIRLLYGGSVKADNAAELFAAEDIDGGLVGGASLKADDFIAIVEATRE
ncbi:MAG: triose-phosphate isomerase [Halieaceae bacterium]